MVSINRAAVIVKPKHPSIDWVSEVFDLVEGEIERDEV